MPHRTFDLTFKEKNALEVRKVESERMRLEYPKSIPVIVEKARSSNLEPKLKNKKFLVPKDCTVGVFVGRIRQKLAMEKTQALFMFVDDVLPPTSAPMAAVYQEHKDEDGFLYLKYAGEETFGCAG